MQDHSYRALLQRHARISHAETARLARLARAGDVEARNAIVAGHLGLVHAALRKFFWKSLCQPGLLLEEGDLFQEGVLGLQRAAELYDPDKGKQFSTYATFWIRHTVSRALMNAGSGVPLPIHLQDAMRQAIAHKTGAPLLNAMRRREEIDWGAIEEGLRREAFNTCELAMELGFVMLDTEAILDEVSEQPESDTTEDDKMLIRGALSILSEMERQVIVAAYGLDGSAEMAQNQIAARLKIAPRKVRAIHDQALERLRNCECLKKR